ncbi:hypothetical protein B0H13DRAFT_1883299 [Mycena leptocephala]|nr:hypothetical protein B0H13DRAFT_1883299 [Mycena leptocephala]
MERHTFCGAKERRHCKAGDMSRNDGDGNVAERCNASTTCTGMSFAGGAVQRGGMDERAASGRDATYTSLARRVEVPAEVVTEADCDRPAGENEGRKERVA